MGLLRRNALLWSIAGGVWFMADAGSTRAAQPRTWSWELWGDYARFASHLSANGESDEIIGEDLALTTIV